MRISLSYTIHGFAAALLLAAGLFPAGARALEAGAGKADITPPLGAPLNGYGARMGRGATAVHDPLWARALYLDDGTTRLFLVSLDLVAVPPELRARVLELAPDVAPRENIILAATHTHSGTGGMTRKMPVRLVSGRFMPEVLEAAATGIVQAMQQAYDTRTRAAVGHGTLTQTDLTHNRRFGDGPSDPQVGVILVEDADGNPISVVANMAAHPTSVGDEDLYTVSADYPGFYCSHLEALTRPECVPLFLNGTQGNQTIGSPPQNKTDWGRTEAEGRTLAERVKEALPSITCGEATLRVASAEPDLPLSLAGDMMPRKVLLQALEINDLLVTFLPGEACVEIGLELRRRALEKGYAAQFSVGLANDYLMYFTPRSLYAEYNYEASMSFYGPLMEDWFYTQFTRLMSKAEAAPDPPAAEPQAREDLPGGAVLLRLAGGPKTVGEARGRVFADTLKQRWLERVERPVKAGEWTPPKSLWAKWPAFMDPSTLMLPVLGMAARRPLKGTPDTAFLEMAGLAQGAGLPFDAVWLLQAAPLFSRLEDKSPLFTAPLCTMAAATGIPAGADDLLVARNLDWPWGDELPVVSVVKPDAGLAFVQIGFPWNAGVFSGMNEAGLVLCMERLPHVTPGAETLDGPPVELILRDMLQSVDKPDTAVANLQALAHVRGVHVLVAGFNGKKAAAAVVEFGPTVTVRRSETNGLLSGVDPLSAAAAPDDAARYARFAALAEGKRIIGDREMQRILGDSDENAPEAARIWSAATRHSAVFIPKSGKVQVAFPDENGRPGPYTTVSLKD